MSDNGRGYGARNPRSDGFDAGDNASIKHVLITVDGDIDKTISLLERGGVQIDAVYRISCTIAATIHAALEADYCALRGVKSIEDDPEFFTG